MYFALTVHDLPVITVFFVCFVLLRFPASPWTSVCCQAALASPALGSSFRWGVIQGQMSDIKL